MKKHLISLRAKIILVKDGLNVLIEYSNLFCYWEACHISDLKGNDSLFQIAIKQCESMLD